MNLLEKKSWSPYAVGAGIGALSWISFALEKRPLGITSAFEDSAALAEGAVAPRLFHINDYLKTREGMPRLGWEWALLFGVLGGSYLSARLSGDRARESVPSLWKRRFGRSPKKRNLGAFVGGALMMFGARMAKGCTSGHGIGGTMQLAASSWLFTPILLASGSLVAKALFGKERG